MINITTYMISLFVAFFLGIVVRSFLVSFSKSDGIMIIDDTDDEKTKWILDVHTDPDDIPKKKKLCLKVHVKK